MALPPKPGVGSDSVLVVGSVKGYTVSTVYQRQGLRPVSAEVELASKLSATEFKYSCTISEKAGPQGQSAQ